MSFVLYRSYADKKAGGDPKVETSDRWHFTVPAALKSADVKSILKGLPLVNGERQFPVHFDMAEGGRVEVMVSTYNGFKEKTPGVWELGSSGGETIRFHRAAGGNWVSEGRVGSWAGAFGWPDPED